MNNKIIRTSEIVVKRCDLVIEFCPSKTTNMTIKDAIKIRQNSQIRTETNSRNHRQKIRKLIENCKIQFTLIKQS